MALINARLACPVLQLFISAILQQSLKSFSLGIKKLHHTDRGFGIVCVFIDYNSRRKINIQ